MQICSTSLDVTTDVKLATNPIIDETCQPFNLSEFDNGSICTLNVTECSMIQTLIPYFSLATFLMTTLPWILGAFIICMSWKEFWASFLSMTERKNKKFQCCAEMIMKKCVFWIGITIYPMSVYILLGPVQIF